MVQAGGREIIRTLSTLSGAVHEPEGFRRYCVEVVHAVAAFPLGRFHTLLRASGAVPLLDHLAKVHVWTDNVHVKTEDDNV